MRNTRIRRRAGDALVGATCLLLIAILAGCQPTGTPPGEPATAPNPPDHAAAVAEAPADDTTDIAQALADVSSPSGEDDETMEVDSCDGRNTVEVSSDLAGPELAAALMDQWKRDHPEANWVAEEKERHALKPPADNSDLLEGGQGEGNTYGSYTERDLLTWHRETEKFVAEGSRIFHDPDALASEVAVSCDMCHPHAANTHAETYPKFQVQLGRVALLRDMIEWCIENPVRGDKLDPDGPTMRALEAYIMSQRKGVALNYGKR